MNPPYVVDLSDNNGHVDFGTLKGAGVEGVIIKATQGIGHVDPDFNNNYVRASEVGLGIIAYHFFDETGDGVAQFNHYRNTVRGLKIGHAIDWEQNEATKAPWCPVATVHNYIAAFHTASGILPVNYCPIAYHAILDPNYTMAYWVPDYATNLGAPPVGHWYLWQFTDHGIEGIPNADVSIFNPGHGNLTDWVTSIEHQF